MIGEPLPGGEMPPEPRPAGPPARDWDMEWAKALWRRTSPGRIAGVIALVLLFWWAASGFYTVQPGEKGVVLTFGRNTGQTEPGLHYRVPWPVQSAYIVDVAKIRRGQGEAVMLTADENLVFVSIVFQYVVKDPVQYLFRVREPEMVGFTTASVALRTVVGKYPMAFIMGDGRTTVENEVKSAVQQLMDNYESGLQATEVRLLRVEPPPEVKSAFDDVILAAQERERSIKDAEAYRERVLPEARGEAAKLVVDAESYANGTASQTRTEAARMVLDAEAYREQRSLTAQGDAQRFLLVLEEYLKAPEVTRERLYSDAIRQTLKDASIYVVDTGPAGGTPLISFAPMPSLALPTPTPTPQGR